MPKWLASGRALAVAAALAALGGPPAARAQSDDFPAVIAALKTMAQRIPPSARAAANGEAVAAENPQFVFPATIIAEPRLVARLNDLFAAFFAKPFDLRPLLRRIVAESAVADVPGVGKIVYDPAHSLFLLLRDVPGGVPDVSVATLADVAKVLGDKRPVGLILGGYTDGLKYFAALSRLMQDEATRATLEPAWTTAPRSPEQRDLVQYLLLRPVQQMREIGNETADCRNVINRFVDDVRGGARAAIPTVLGLSGTLLPTRFVRQGDRILLVLSDPVIARLYVVGQLDVANATCKVVAETALFVM